MSVDRFKVFWEIEGLIKLAHSDHLTQPETGALYATSAVLQRTLSDRVYTFLCSVKGLECVSLNVHAHPRPVRSLSVQVKAPSASSRSVGQASPEEQKGGKSIFYFGMDYAELGGQWGCRGLLRGSRQHFLMSWTGLKLFLGNREQN
ncbi:hypothetical protein TNIN_263591 [Trichonephila inaurata madagascariensis]|uniref:Uncharacterized protein n=1 Tax=Trichonephila inaurata madagascariensis TaxID=2747483 RepID=A0A8X6JM39_9ARAC|nr:hypothetical protein TNIN_263511 [Trichonephila inaurata madagascariensis]GFS43191.1 hypothetical protein TNIN_263591 [Trichonephila inaurata madagascariensis]